MCFVFVLYYFFDWWVFFDIYSVEYGKFGDVFFGGVGKSGSGMFVIFMERFRLIVYVIWICLVFGCVLVYNEVG